MLYSVKISIALTQFFPVNGRYSKRNTLFVVVLFCSMTPRYRTCTGRLYLLQERIKTRREVRRSDVISEGGRRVVAK